MNDEIKEILDKWKCYIGLTKKFSNNDMELLRVEDIEKVLDYITNLQQIEQEHKKINGELREENSKLEIALQNIQEDYDRRTEENERLKFQLENQQIISSKYRMRRNIYKSRCEKASEDIKDIFKDEDWYKNYDYNDLANALKNALNILQNGSEKDEC